MERIRLTKQTEEKKWRIKKIGGCSEYCVGEFGQF